ncbi:MAG TPA: HAMP domain-containing protein, partial [Nocardioides sp.]|nr:HAMP domain-containing protein [Nocardioides sp.]
MTVLPTFGAEGRWHYRRSLASRVAILTAMAVGVTVAVVALGAYITVRMQLQSSLDNSLVDRAQSTARAVDDQVDRLIQGGGATQTYLLPASDVRIGYMRYDGQSGFTDRGEVIRLDDHEEKVADGETRRSVRTVRAGGVDYRVVAVPIKGLPGYALVVAQSLEPQQQVLTKLGLVTLLFGIAGMIIAGIAGWGVARNGLRPVRRLTATAEDIARTERLAPIPVEGDDEVARLAS